MYDKKGEKIYGEKYESCFISLGEKYVVCVLNFVIPYDSFMTKFFGDDIFFNALCMLT